MLSVSVCTSALMSALSFTLFDTWAVAFEANLLITTYCSFVTALMLPYGAILMAQTLSL